MQKLYYFSNIIVKGKKYYVPILISKDQYSLEKLKKKKCFIYLKNFKFKSLSLLKIKQNIKKFFIIINYNNFNNKIIKNKGNKILYKFFIYKESYCKIFSNRLKKIRNLFNLQYLYLNNLSKIYFNVNMDKCINIIYFYYKLFFLIQKKIIYNILSNIDNKITNINYDYYINFINFIKGKFSYKYNYKFNSNYIYKKIYKEKGIQRQEILD